MIRGVGYNKQWQTYIDQRTRLSQTMTLITCF